MERIRVLIDKLQEQAAQQTDPAQLLMTVQMIQSELQQLQQQGAKKIGTSKVAVVLPSFISNGKTQQGFAGKNGEEAKVIELDRILDPQPLSPAFTYDPMVEIPTLSHQVQGKDINEMLGDAAANHSLNDRLKEQKKEVGERLMDAPIQDLRKAIGINDRFTFISELFRGDEPMYERSLKTINSFNIYHEAEYWISRELQIKLGWDGSSETVQHFYQLVRRRFSSM